MRAEQETRENAWSRAAAVSIAFLLFVLRPGTAWAESYGVTVEHNATAVMRDGTKLRADIYRPKAEGKFPVLLVRTPYDKTREMEFGVRAAARGYVVVAQDVRGRFQSEGDWYPFKNESQDGYDTVEWAAALPYANGKVGMFGGSYVGATQYLAAIAKPPHLAGICPNVTASNYHDGWTYQGGAFEQWFNESWSTGLAMNTMQRRVESGQKAVAWTQKLPLMTYPVLEAPSAEGIAPYFADWLEHPNYDEYWKQWSIEDHYAQIQVPVFSLGAWYDIFLGGTLRNYARLKNEAGTEEARRGQKLMVYVGGHAGGSDNKKVGAVDFGEKLPFDLNEVMLNWYDALLKGATNAASAEKPVKIFVMGKNEWRDEDDWPLTRARSTKYYLHSAGAASTAIGDGTLSTTTPGAEKADQFTYDPNDAVPTLAGRCAAELSLLPGWGRRIRAKRKRAAMCWCLRRLRWRRIWKSRACFAGLVCEQLGGRYGFYGETDRRVAERTRAKSYGGILRLRYRNSQEKPDLAKPARLITSRWICGRRATCSWPGTSCGWKFPAATFRGSTAI